MDILVHPFRDELFLMEEDKMIVLWKFLQFLLVFLIAYFISYIVGFRKLKKFDKRRVPANINYLIVKYKLNIVKLGYKKVYKLLMLCDSFIIAFLFIVTSFIKNIYIRMGLCFLLIFPLFLIVYSIVGNYYKKKCNRKDNKK